MDIGIWILAYEGFLWYCLMGMISQTQALGLSRVVSYP